MKIVTKYHNMTLRKIKLLPFSMQLLKQLYSELITVPLSRDKVFLINLLRLFL